jgi:hypothetical protein
LRTLAEVKAAVYRAEEAQRKAEEEVREQHDDEELRYAKDHRDGLVTKILERCESEIEDAVRARRSRVEVEMRSGWSPAGDYLADEVCKELAAHGYNACKKRTRCRVRYADDCPDVDVDTTDVIIELYN